MSDIPQKDEPKPVRTVERVREWEHPKEVKGGFSCDKKDKPVYTDPGKIPAPCDGGIDTNYGVWPCDNTDWASKGIVHRIKEDGKVINREGDKPFKVAGDGRDGRDKV